MPEARIFVNTNGKNITILPTRQYFGTRATSQPLRWIAQGNGVSVGQVTFSVKSPGAPITDLREDPNNPGEWIGTWNTGERGVFGYSIQVQENGVDVGPPVDPEIENDPPSTEEDEGGG